MAREVTRQQQDTAEAKAAAKAAKAAKAKAAKEAKAVSAEDAQTGRPRLCRDARGVFGALLWPVRVLSQAYVSPPFCRDLQHDVEAKTSLQKKGGRLPYQREPLPPQFCSTSQSDAEAKASALEGAREPR